MRSQTCCITGHRQTPPEKRAEIAGQLERVIVSLYQRGVRFYGAGGAHSVFLFFFAIFALSISVTSASALYALFSIVFFATGVMVITILQPFGKILAYSSIRKKYNHK